MFSLSLSKTFYLHPGTTYYIELLSQHLKLFELRYEVPAKSWPLTCSADERSSQKETFDGRQQEYSIWVINFPPPHSTLEKGRDYTRKIVGFSWFFPLTILGELNICMLCVTDGFSKGGCCVLVTRLWNISIRVTGIFRISSTLHGW